MAVVGRRFGEASVAAVGRVNVGGSESTGSWRWSVGRRFGEASVAAVGRVNVGGSESTRSWRWSVGRRFGEASVAAVGRVNVGGCVFVLVKRFGEHVVTVVVESRGLESHENRLIQSHRSAGGSERPRLRRSVESMLEVRRALGRGGGRSAGGSEKPRLRQ